jgi:hypothetical protein
MATDDTTASITDAKPAPRIHLLTVAGIAALAYVLSTWAHEGGGHGGMCVALGGKPAVWGAYYFDCDYGAMPEWGRRAVAAAGSTANLILCLLFSLALNADLKRTGKHGGWTVFLWLMAAVNGFEWAGYYMFSGVANIGDWSTGRDGVLYGLSWALPARIVMAAGGFAVYVWLARTFANQLGRITGSNMTAARKICFTAYVTGGLVAVSIGFLNPMGWVIVLISSAASSLGGTSGLFWGFRLMKRDLKGVDFDLPLNLVWIGLGIVAAVVYAVVFGPSLKFH